LSPPVLHGGEAAGGQTAGAAGGRPAKHRFGPQWGWLLKALRHGKVLRGTPLDPMAWTRDRREDRAVLAEFCAVLARILERLDASTHEEACRLIELADQIKGYGPVRQAGAAQVRPQWAAFLASGQRSVGAVEGVAH